MYKYFIYIYKNLQYKCLQRTVATNVPLENNILANHSGSNIIIEFLAYR